MTMSMYWNSFEMDSCINSSTKEMDRNGKCFGKYLRKLQLINESQKLRCNGSSQTSAEPPKRNHHPFCLSVFLSFVCLFVHESIPLFVFLLFFVLFFVNFTRMFSHFVGAKLLTGILTVQYVIIKRIKWIDDDLLPIFIVKCMDNSKFWCFTFICYRKNRAKIARRFEI